MSNIPEKKITFQYQGDPTNTPSVANGSEITVYAETIDEIFQKEPNFTPIPKGPEQHYKGPETLVVDTLKATHKFQITGWVYNKSRKKFSFDENDFDSNNDIQVSDTITAQDLDTFVPLGDAMIKYGTLSVTGTSSGSLSEGSDYEVDRDRGRIKFLSSGSVSTTTEEDFFGNTNTIINEDFELTYTSKGSARNAAKALQKMSQLGGTIVMRVGKSTYTSADSEEFSKTYTVLPKKIKANNKAGKPDETKLEMEFRVSSDKRTE